LRKLPFGAESSAPDPDCFISKARLRVARSAKVSVEVFAGLHADVGEAPHWDDQTGTLLFVDLTGGVVFRYDQSGAQLASFSVGQEVGAVVPRRDGGLVLAVRDGIAVASDTGAGFAVTAPVERDIPGNRMNDAKCDPAGRLLAGTMAYDLSPHAAALYRVEPDWSFGQVVRGVTQSNGIAWRPDGRRMYFIDSATRGIDVFDYDADAGFAGNRRRLVTMDPARGIPDGMAADDQGNLWVACFGGAAVRCFSPAGEQLDEISFPVSQVTSCAFGGPGLADLYVTTAAYRLSAGQLDREPHAGATFVCRTGAAGLPASSFAG
jgi:sugar lactone lactonase YvrE